MGSSSSSRNKIPNAQELMHQTGFSSAHLLRLHDRFESLDRDNRGYLSPDDFEVLGGLAMNPIGGRIIEAFFSSGQDTVDFSSFVRILAHFRPTDRNRNKEGTQQELPSSRTRKLKCESRSLCSVFYFIFAYNKENNVEAAQLPFSCTIWTEMGRFPERSFFRSVSTSLRVFISFIADKFIVPSHAQRLSCAVCLWCVGLSVRSSLFAQITHLQPGRRSSYSHLAKIRGFCMAAEWREVREEFLFS
uniref:Calcineurin-like EF-hand protein 2 n=1 Tax=Haplochromis burtoni TaxID=8153 RepID=A0A3Q2X0E7_HAPBU